MAIQPFDAQFWGVPQRRKRIALVADFGGLTAPEILFERQGVPGYIKPCGKGSCVWASEIEDFPIAVTKYHFPDEVNNDG